MPAPVLNYVPRASDGSPSPGFVPGFNGVGRPRLWQQHLPAAPGGPGMGNFMSMNQLNPGAAAGGQAWQGPWQDVNEVQGSTPLDTSAAAQGFHGMYPGQYGAQPGFAGLYPGQYGPQSPYPSNMNDWMSLSGMGAGPNGVAPPPAPHGGGWRGWVLPLGLGAAATLLLSSMFGKKKR